ncbi:RND family efflux transporter MFP subunit [Sulfuritortus calidifontis]|uniref:RND family efflux transporter MFP subunit n=1 Tax=Sulfuritortus calidifontis TaxID=1914471 RepID=A0A4R3JW65_9PROT|nr:efflux RND transporter periplasmic adaptor subunit [Sulfuritortus calidifontis]TCS70418.1 RND family efflux transporter MFP subunit [Sulfuritortus calidifontis]
MKKRIALLWLMSSAAWAADYPAVLHWSQLSGMSAAAPGVVERVPVQAGQAVRQGELLLVLEPARYQAQVMAARAELERLQAEEAEAKRNLDRQQELYARTVTATTELDAAKLNLAQAKAAVQTGQARLELARRQLAETELRAPFPALVVDRPAEPGMVVAECQPVVLVTIARSDEILARASLTPGQAAGVNVGAAATVQIGDKAYAGKVKSLRFVLGDKPAYWLEVAIPRSARWMAGQAATIKLP